MYNFLCQNVLIPLKCTLPTQTKSISLNFNTSHTFVPKPHKKNQQNLQFFIHDFLYQNMLTLPNVYYRHVLKACH